MNRLHKSIYTFIYRLLIAAILLTSCAQATVLPPTNTTQPTNTPVPTDTPQPTFTPTPVPTDTPVPTPTPTPTPDLQATQSFQATQTMDAVLASIDADLKTVEFSISQGHLGYYYPDRYSIDNKEYNMIYYNQLDPGNSYKNFVLHTDITWESTSGLAGCGLILRAQEPLLDGKAFLFGTWRLSGYPAWDLNFWNYGEPQSSISGLFKRNDAIKQDNGSTNEYLLVLNEKTMAAYANGTRIGGISIDAIKDSGKLGIFTRQESGETTCTFTNTWVWSLD